ncbi:MAG TPA: DinB family protein, partial [Gemmatimonadaceae bacterium]|nr:DinB family protein [Gemmatimonadaceae bacterium]
LESLHRRWIALLRALPAADFARTLRHPEWGNINLDEILALYAWHGAHHTAHVTRLREREGWA